MKCLTGWLALAMLAFAWPNADAHVASNSFYDLTVRGSAVEGSIELAVRDTELAVGVDANHDGRITWGELRAAESSIKRYLQQHLVIWGDQRICPLVLGQLQVNSRVDGNYAWLAMSARCSGTVTTLQLDYDVLAGADPSHRGLLKVSAGAVTQTAVLEAGHITQLQLARSDRWRTFKEYLAAGIEHIWSGIDHLLFLLSLLLPAVLVRRQDRWEAVEHARPAFMGILQVVTAFTLAHSITLSLAAFNVIHLPSRLTESVIAASIIVAALNNLIPVVTDARARIAFAFGLLHGFGFASVLAELGLPAGARALALVSFNLGIEVGQLAVVVLVMPLAYSARRAAIYRRALLPAGSMAIAAIALVWFIQRAF